MSLVDRKALKMKNLTLKWYYGQISKFSSSNVLEESGVYIFVWVKDGLIKRILYVGQSENLRDRISQHLSKSHNPKLRECITKCSNNIEFKFAYVNTNQLNGVESYLYYKIHPIFNENTPPGDKQIPCNLPSSLKPLY